jgi:hypothetical protein
MLKACCSSNRFTSNRDGRLHGLGRAGRRAEGSIRAVGVDQTQGEACSVVPMGPNTMTSPTAKLGYESERWLPIASAPFDRELELARQAYATRSNITRTGSTQAADRLSVGFENAAAKCDHR